MKTLKTATKLAPVLLLFLASAFAMAAPPVVVPVRSADPGDTDFADLAALGESIGGARIVMLGEQTHGDGATLLAKTRVLKYLHERHGFDVLAFESGMYDLHAAQNLVEGGEKPSAAMAKAIFPVWADSDQVRPLLAYLDAQAAAGSPLALTGFDFQVSNELGRDLPEALQRQEGLVDSGGALQRLGDLVGAVLKEGPAAVSGASLQSIGRDVATGRERLAASDLPDAEYWRQMVASTGRLLVFLKRLPEGTAEVFNMRDAQMAANLEWLAETAYPGRKIIAWGATSHFVKDRTVLDVKTAQGMVPMGSLLAQKFGSQVYVLAFTAGGGKSASYARRETIEWGAAPAGSIEDAIGKSGNDFAFLSSQMLSSSLPGKRTSWMLGFDPIPGLWPQAVDGIFYIRDMQPATYSARSP